MCQEAETPEQAVERTLSICIEENIMKDFLIKNQERVREELLDEIKEQMEFDEHLHALQEDFKKQSQESGNPDEYYADLARELHKIMPPEHIAPFLNIPMELVEKALQNEDDDEDEDSE
jgi:hypothetical protein